MIRVMRPHQEAVLVGSRAEHPVAPELRLDGADDELIALTKKLRVRPNAFWRLLEPRDAPHRECFRRQPAQLLVYEDNLILEDARTHRGHIKLSGGQVEEGRHQVPQKVFNFRTESFS